MSLPYDLLGIVFAHLSAPHLEVSASSLLDLRLVNRRVCSMIDSPAMMELWRENNFDILMWQLVTKRWAPKLPRKAVFLELERELREECETWLDDVVITGGATQLANFALAFAFERIRQRAKIIAAQTNNSTAELVRRFDWHGKPGLMPANLPLDALGVAVRRDASCFDYAEDWPEADGNNDDEDHSACDERTGIRLESFFSGAIEDDDWDRYASPDPFLIEDAKELEDDWLMNEQDYWEPCNDEQQAANEAQDMELVEDDMPSSWNFLHLALSSYAVWHVNTEFIRYKAMEELVEVLDGDSVAELVNERCVATSNTPLLNFVSSPCIEIANEERPFGAPPSVKRFKWREGDDHSRAVGDIPGLGIFWLLRKLKAAGADFSVRDRLGRGAIDLFLLHNASPNANAVDIKRIVEELTALGAAPPSPMIVNLYQQYFGESERAALLEHFDEAAEAADDECYHACTPEIRRHLLEHLAQRAANYAMSGRYFRIEPECILLSIPEFFKTFATARHTK